MHGELKVARLTEAENRLVVDRVGRGGGKLSPLTVLQMNDKLINSLFFFFTF